jgi:uncharacterized protein YbbC (DUF1343 family)
MYRAGVVRTGLERLLAERVAEVRSGAWGLLAHPASVDGQLRHAFDRLVAAGVEIPVLFGPEHGWQGAAQDMESVNHAETGRRVVSLYGDRLESLRPSREDLNGLTGVIVDLQDVGARYYTYAVTMVYVMEACAAAGVAVMVLDRPNPIDGVTVEGPTVEPGYESFVSGLPIPIRHGLTMGEIAGWSRRERNIDVDLRVVTMEGWRREFTFDETGLPWVLPSPNMPTLDSAIVYPGGCLIEGTTLSEGRGTTRPFELVGAPGLDPVRFASQTAEEAGPGVVLRPTVFKPMFQKHAGRHCGGMQIHVTDRSRFSSLRTTVAQLVAARRLAPDGFGWREEAYEFVDDQLAIDLLFGSAGPRQAIEAGASVEEVMGPFGDFARRFEAARRDALLYPS